MKKYLFYILLTFIMIFSFSNVKASSFECVYSRQGEHNSYKKYIKIVADNNKIKQIYQGDNRDSINISVPIAIENTIFTTCYDTISFKIQKKGKYDILNTGTSGDVVYNILKEKKCKYYVDASELSTNFYVDFEIYIDSNNNATSVLNRYKDALYNISGGTSKIKNWSNYYSSSLKCPEYAIVVPGSFSSDIYVSDNYNDLISYYNKNNGQPIKTYSNENQSDEKVKENRARIQALIDAMNNSYNNMEDKYKSCKENSICPYCNCRDSIDANYKIIKQKIRELRMDVKAEIIDENEPLLKTLEDTEIVFDDNTNKILADIDYANQNGTDPNFFPDKREEEQPGFDVKTCEGLIGDNTLILLRKFRNLIMIIGPILALVLGTYDLVVAMANGEEEAKKKGMKKMKGRLIAAALLLLVPYILDLLLNIINTAGKSCV